MPIRAVTLISTSTTRMHATQFVQHLGHQPAPCDLEPAGVVRRSNGHVCLDILYDGRNGGWSPALTINKVVMSLRSMLASNQDKVQSHCLPSPSCHALYGCFIQLAAM